MPEQGLTTVTKVACRRPSWRQLSGSGLGSKRHDHPQPRRANRAPSPSLLRPASVRLDAAIYRRRRRIVGFAVAGAVTVLALVVRSGLDVPGSEPTLAPLFSPLVCVPAMVWCGIALLRWSGSGSRRPASPAPAARTGSSRILDNAA